MTPLCLNDAVLFPVVIRFQHFFQAEDKEEDGVSGEPEASPSADTTILFVKGEGERGLWL